MLLEGCGGVDRRCSHAPGCIGGTDDAREDKSPSDDDDGLARQDVGASVREVETARKTFVTLFG
ncbi:MAG: hypothetical protein AB7K24_11460 [Gemmataceae bacterium]